MAKALVFNPGSNSLKFELIETVAEQQIASEATKIASAALDNIGKKTKLSVYRDREAVGEQKRAAQDIEAQDIEAQDIEAQDIEAQDIEAEDMAAAVRAALKWLRDQQSLSAVMDALELVGVRVVHGGTKYSAAVRVTSEVRHDIEDLEDLAPLHNKSSLDILDVLSSEMPQVPAFVTFDTAFHRTLPEVAWRYPIERETADKYGIRKFGFHGVSHRYMLEQYANTVGKPKEQISIVTLHMESGSSACAIANGKSVDTTMGLTPLEGLMMGTRSGSIDPAILPYLMRKQDKSADDTLTLLNKRSGLIGIAGETLDTRELVKRDDAAAKLALAMFSYRVRLAVGAYLAALGDAEAVLFGGGIGEDSPWLRADVCAGLGGWGLELDRELNDRSTSGQVRVSIARSRLHAWAMPVEEALQIAHECVIALAHEKG